MEHGANQQLSTIDRCYTGAYDHLAVVSVDLSHHWLIGVNVLDTNDLKKKRKEKKKQRWSLKGRGYKYCLILYSTNTSNSRI